LARRRGPLGEEVKRLIAGDDEIIRAANTAITW